MNDLRQSYDEISALVASVAKALDMNDADVVFAIEQGQLGMEMCTDAEGKNYLLVTHENRIAHVYPGAVFRPVDSSSVPDSSGTGLA